MSMQMPNGIIAKSAQHVFHIVPDDVIVFITQVNYIHFDFPCEKKPKKMENNLWTDEICVSDATSESNMLSQ